MHSIDVHNARLESSDPGARGITLMFASDEEKFHQVNLLLRAAIMRVTSQVLIKRQEDLSSLQALLNLAVFCLKNFPLQSLLSRKI